MGGNGGGTIFRLNSDGTDYRVLHRFADSSDDGFYASAALLKGNDGAFYGTTGFGGDSGLGTIFRISELAPSITITLNAGFSTVTLSWPSDPDFVLQENSDLGASGWSDFGGVVNDNGTLRNAIVPARAGNMFYRLRK
jgi:uncharacterized repeat protein (TIGR03803 family)